MMPLHYMRHRSRTSQMLRARLPVSRAACKRHVWLQHRCRSCGLMDKALVFGTKDCRFESCQDQAKVKTVSCGATYRVLCVSQHNAVSPRFKRKLHLLSQITFALLHP